MIYMTLSLLWVLGLLILLITVVVLFYIYVTLISV